MQIIDLETGQLQGDKEPEEPKIIDLNTGQLKSINKPVADAPVIPVAEVAQPQLENAEPAQEGRRIPSLGTPQLDFGAGVAEAAAAVGSSVGLSVIAGLDGLYEGAKTILTGGSGEEALNKAVGAIESMQSKAYQPRTDAGDTGLQMVGQAAEAAQFAPSMFLGGLKYMTGSEAEDALEAAEEYRKDPAKYRGNAVFDSTGSVSAAVLAEVAPDAIGLVLGIRSPKAFKGYSTNKQARLIKEYIDSVGADNVPSTQQLIAPPKTGVTPTQILPKDISAAPISALERAELGQRVVTSTAAKEAVRQGFSQKRIDLFNTLGPLDKAKAREMLNVANRSRTSERYAAGNRTTDVVGDSLVSRYNFIKGKKNDAGKRINKVVRKLSNEPVNYDNAVNSLLDELTDFDVKVNYTDGGINFDFSNSVLSESPVASNLLSNSLKRISEQGGQNVRSGHMLKKYLDTELSKPSTTEGLPGNVNAILGNFRRRVNNSIKKEYKEYRKVNDQYADTKGVLDDLQKAVGKSIDLESNTSGKAAGQAFRRVLSNAQSRQMQIDTIAKMDNVAAKYGASFKDSVFDQIIVADELEKMFNLAPRTSLQGQVQSGVGQSIIDSTISPELMGQRAAANLFDKTANKVRGINDDAAIKAIGDLLK
tara:strand:+ start:725 stop:2668 length:1944 start_codon:yes stop_codon:yes gene_type:complete